MTRSFALFILGLSGFSLVGAASADTFQATFKYNTSASVQANYDAFQRIARKACAVDLKEVGGIGPKMKLEADCNTRLMNDAVSAFGREELSDLHQQSTGAQARILAAAR